jgi:hypothetical protein
MQPSRQPLRTRDFASYYCPDQPVTRGQMAVFLAKALGLHFPN